jgi:hypothetical protein
MTDSYVAVVLVFIQQLAAQRPERVGDAVKALQAGIMEALDRVQGQRGDYANALANLGLLYCEKKPTKMLIGMTSDAIRRADGEGSCQAVKNVLAKLDKGVANDG